jgi:phosphopentomutase
MSSDGEKTDALVEPLKVRVKFGTAGIRGTYGQEVTIRETIAVCFAVNRLLGRGRFGVGYDTRMTSFVLGNVASSAMNWYGSDVDDYGVIPTPVLAFTIKLNKLHAGFSVTASHNPPEYAGVKVFGIDGIEFSLEDERKLERLVQESEEFMKPQEDIGSFGTTSENEQAVLSYKEALVGRSKGMKKRFKILVDCANGTACSVTPNILRELGHQVVTVNSHPSPNFPGRLPEPTNETLVEVAGLTRAMGADFAIAHDGDADRLVMIDELGRVVPDHILSALALKVIVEGGGRGNVIISMNSSSAVEKVAEELGCRVQRSRLGKTFEELYKKRGIFASEPSKMVDPRWGYWEDGIYTSVLITQFLSEKGLKLSQLLESIPQYYNVQANISMPTALDYGCVKSALKEAFGSEVESFDELDGVKMFLRNGSWVMLRTSGTEKKARAYAESKKGIEALSLLDRAKKIAISCGV